MKLFLFLVLFQVLGVARADLVKDQFCERSRNFSQDQIIAERENRISFQNRGGIFNGGVCWWHSRLQRAATYLTIYRPDLAKPTTSAQVRGLLSRIRSLKEVVEIPGYRNFYEFTEAWSKTTQKFLNHWQLEDGIFRQGMIRGLQGSPRGNAEKLQDLMIQLKKQVFEQRKISYLKLQLKGITAHAWLVFSIEEIAQGLRLHIVDSNYDSIRVYEYFWGDQSIETGDYGSFIPYLEQSKELNRIDSTVSAFCATASPVSYGTAY